MDKNLESILFGVDTNSNDSRDHYSRESALEGALEASFELDKAFTAIENKEASGQQATREEKARARDVMLNFYRNAFTLMEEEELEVGRFLARRIALAKGMRDDTDKHPTLYECYSTILQLASDALITLEKIHHVYGRILTEEERIMNEEIEESCD